MSQAPGITEPTPSARCRKARWSRPLRTLLKFRYAKLCLLALLAAAAVFTLADWLARPPHVHPTNIILITIDALRADVLGCYGFKTDVGGSPQSLSPNLDRIAAEGVLFERAYAQSDWTGPSMASMLYSQPPGPTPVGDYSYINPSANFLGILKNLQNDAGGFELTAFITNPILANPVFASNFDRVSFFLSPHYASGETPYPYPDLAYERCDTVLDALTRSMGHDRTRKKLVPGNTFKWVHLMDVHEPWTPPQKWRSLFPQPPADFGEVNHAFLEGNRDKATLEGIRSLRADYFASLLYLDDRLGRWYDWARHKGFLKNTLVIVTSDHGQAFAEHDAFLHETWMGNEEVHVPYIVVGSNPRTARPVPQGVKISSVVSASLDTLPTIAQAWGFGTTTMRGESLLAFIEGPGTHTPDRPAAYSCRGATFRGGNNILERWTFPNGMIYVKKTDLVTKALKEELYNGNADYSMTAPITDVDMLSAARSESLQVAGAPARQGRTQPGPDPVTRDRLRALGYLQPPPQSTAFGP